MKAKLHKLYLTAKRIIPVLTVVLLLGQIPVAYWHLIDQIQGVQQGG